MFQVDVLVWLGVIGVFKFANGSYSDTSETREILSLDGIWDCFCERSEVPFAYREHRGLKKLNGVFKIPVPGSLVDFATQMDSKACLRIWYERSFFIPKSWKYERRIWIRIDGLIVNADLWINGNKIQNHSFFEWDITDLLVFDAENWIAISIDKRLENQDLFPEIPKSVILRSIPEVLFIQSVQVDASVTNTTGIVSYKISVGGLLRNSPKCVLVEVFDKDNTQIIRHVADNTLEGSFSIPDCNLWWPWCMDSKRSYLYTLVFKVFYKYCESDVKDVYRMKYGIRPLTWSMDSIKINNKPLYLQGVETSDDWTRKPFDPSIGLKDATLLKWLGANTLVTMLAPSEEFLDLADELGLLVILGSPRNAFEDTVIRYRHHSSVILWSLLEGDDYISNESGLLNESFINRIRFLDCTRPITSVVPLSTDEKSLKVKQLDIISLDLEDSNLGVGNSINCSFLRNTIDRFQKPVILMYGNKFFSTNNRIRTYNYDPFSEVSNNLDKVKRNSSIVGEFFGNFVAYEHFEDENLILENGILDRNREPTTSADFVRLKFRPRRSPCPFKTPRCHFYKKPQKRFL